jgi:hypothetical protein
MNCAVSAAGKNRVVPLAHGLLRLDPGAGGRFGRDRLHLNSRTVEHCLHIRNERSPFLRMLSGSRIVNQRNTAHRL